MYDYISGRVVSRGADAVVVEQTGIGYRIEVPGSTAGRLPTQGDVRLYVHHVVRDDRPTLYGFLEPEERRLFLKLQEVSRVGPTMALGLLSALEPATLAQAIEAGDVAALARVKGVGRRTAERLCVELKGRVGTVAGTVPLTDQRVSLAAALVALGYPQAVADHTAVAVAHAAATDASLEQLLKLALARLARSKGGESRGAED